MVDDEYETVEINTRWQPLANVGLELKQQNQLSTFLVELRN